MSRRARRDIFAYAKVILCLRHSGIIFALHSRSEYHPATPDITSERQYLSPNGEYNRKKPSLSTWLFFGAPDRNRTCTESPRPEPESGASACSATGAYTAFAVIISLKLPISGNGRKAIFRRVYRPRCRARKLFSPYFHR